MADSNRWMHGLLVGTGLLLTLCAVARAESLWDRRTRSAGFLYTDNLASEIGDSLTVLVAEETSFELEGGRALEKTTGSSGKLNVETPLVDVGIPAGQLDQESSRTFDGSLDYNDTRQFVDSVTVTIIDTLPNGNLVIAGRSQRDVAGEKAVTVLSGVVKPQDVSGANTVTSTRIAYLDVYYETSGPGESYVKDGWFNRILNIFWPF